MQHEDAATVARQLIAASPGVAALEPEERERLQQTIEGIILRARAPQDLAPEQRPWSRSAQALVRRNPRRGDSAS